MQKNKTIEEAIDKWGDLNKHAATRAITPPGFAVAFYNANK